jgi:hypothetical protein
MTEQRVMVIFYHFRALLPLTGCLPSDVNILFFCKGRVFGKLVVNEEKLPAGTERSIPDVRVNGLAAVFCIDQVKPRLLAFREGMPSVSESLGLMVKRAQCPVDENSGLTPRSMKYSVFLSAETITP